MQHPTRAPTQDVARPRGLLAVGPPCVPGSARVPHLHPTRHSRHHAPLPDAFVRVRPPRIQRCARRSSPHPMHHLARHAPHAARLRRVPRPHVPRRGQRAVQHPTRAPTQDVARPRGLLAVGPPCVPGSANHQELKPHHYFACQELLPYLVVNISLPRIQNGKSQSILQAHNGLAQRKPKLASLACILYPPLPNRAQLGVLQPNDASTENSLHIRVLLQH